MNSKHKTKVASNNEEMHRQVWFGSERILNNLYLKQNPTIQMSLQINQFASNFINESILNCFVCTEMSNPFFYD